MAVLVLCLLQFVDVLGVTVVVTALPRMLSDLGAPASAAGIVSTGYAACFGGLLLLGARLGDRFGHRRTILGGVAAFALGSLLAALAGSVAVLAAARCLQGAAAAISVPSALRLLTTLTAEGAARRRAIAAWSAAGAAAGATGFVVGGVVTQTTGWRVIFWGGLVLAAALALGVLRAVPADPSAPRPVAPDPDPGLRRGAGRADAESAPLSLNAPGAATFTAAVVALVVGTTLVAEPGSRAIGALVVVAALGCAVAFVAVDRRATAPLVPAAAARLPTLRAGAAAACLNTATTSSAVTLLTLYLQDTLGRTPLSAAATLLPFSVAVIAGSALAAPLLRRVVPRRAVAVGLGLVAAGDALFALVVGTAWALPVAVALGGLGIGVSSVAATGLATDVPEAHRATASGIVNPAAQVGTAVGIAAILLIAAAFGTTPAEASPVPAAAWLLTAAVALAGAFAFAFGRAPRAR